MEMRILSFMNIKENSAACLLGIRRGPETEVEFPEPRHWLGGALCPKLLSTACWVPPACKQAGCDVFLDVQR